MGLRSARAGRPHHRDRVTLSNGRIIVNDKNISSPSTQSLGRVSLCTSHDAKPLFICKRSAVKPWLAGLL